MSLQLTQQRKLFKECLEHLEQIEYDDEDDNCFYWWSRDINTANNNKWFLSNYGYLRKQFALPQMTRKPVKVTSQVLGHMCKQCKFEMSRRARAYTVHLPDGERKRTTSAFIEVRMR